MSKKKRNTDSTEEHGDVPGNVETLAKIDEILMHVRSLDAQLAWTIRAQAGELKPLLLEFFSSRRRAASVFLAVNGERSVSQIAEYLKTLNPGIRIQNVSNELNELAARGLVELRAWGIYKKSKIDSILRISDELRRHPDLASIK